MQSMQRGLAGAVVADEAEDLAVAQLEVDLVDGGDAAEALDDVAALEHAPAASSAISPRLGRHGAR